MRLNGGDARLAARFRWGPIVAGSPAKFPQRVSGRLLGLCATSASTSSDIQTAGSCLPLCWAQTAQSAQRRTLLSRQRLRLGSAPPANAPSPRCGCHACWRTTCARGYRGHLWAFLLGSSGATATFCLLALLGWAARVIKRLLGSLRRRPGVLFGSVWRLRRFAAAHAVCRGRGKVFASWLACSAQGLSQLDRSPAARAEFARLDASVVKITRVQQ
jgi:hypothetical protein